MKWGLHNFPERPSKPNGTYVSQVSGGLPGPSAKRAGAVTIVGQLSKMCVQLTGVVAFSHLLTPRDIGLVAMLAVFISFGDIIRDFGLSQAAIQTPKLGQRHPSLDITSR